MHRGGASVPCSLTGYGDHGCPAPETPLTISTGSGETPRIVRFVGGTEVQVRQKRKLVDPKVVEDVSQKIRRVRVFYWCTQMDLQRERTAGAFHGLGGDGGICANNRSLLGDRDLCPFG